MSEHVFEATTFDEAVTRAKQEALESAQQYEECPACGVTPPIHVEWALYGDGIHMGLACECACGRDWWARARWTKEGA